MRDHLKSGDRLLGSGRMEAAIAEYQVALRRRGDDPAVLLRLAHGYARLNRLDETAQYYERLLARDSAFADQAIADYLAMARRALEQQDRARFARALEQLQAIQPGGVPDALALPFARYYYELGEYASALPLYLTVLADESDQLSPAVRFELGRVYYELGECGQALVHFRSYLRTSGPLGESRSDAAWHAGQCAYQLAQQDRRAGRPTEAVEKYELVIRLGTPQSLLDDAWFERGEVLFSVGEFADATISYERVLELNPSRTGRKVRTAEERIRAIRYRRTREEER